MKQIVVIIFSKENDLLVINRNQIYQAKGSKNNRILTLQIADSFMQRNYEAYTSSRFQCFSGEVDLGRETVMNQLLKLIAELMLTYFRRSESYLLEIQSYITDILLILIRRFKQEDNLKARIDSDNQRIMQIINYMEKEL